MTATVKRPQGLAGPREGNQSRRVPVRLILAAASFAIGAAASLMFFRLHVSRLPAATDIVGYPIVANFDVLRYNDVYDAILVFPVVGAVAYLVLDAAARRLGALSTIPALWPVASRREADTHEATESVIGWWGRSLRVVMTAAMVALTAAVYRGWLGTVFWPRFAGVVAGTAMVIGAGGWILSLLTRGRQRSPAASLAMVNACVAALLPLGLLASSSVTQVTVLSDGTTHGYMWMPVWLGIALTAGAVAFVAISIARAGATVAERRALMYVAAPLGLFLLTARITAFVAGPTWAFEDGQLLTSQHLLTAGAVPWRDFLDAHGLLSDAILPAIGTSVVQNSLWGLTNSYFLLIDPLCIVFTYYLLARVFRGNLPFLAAVTIALLNTKIMFPFERFMFWPLILILLAATIERPGRWRAILLGAALVGQAILTPEATYCIVGVGAAVLLSNAYHWRRGDSVLVTFNTTLWTVTGGAICAALFAGYLFSQHAIGAFINYYAVFVPGHDLGGGIPLLALSSKTILFWVAAPIVGVGLAVVYLTARLALRRRLIALDWVMLATAIVTALYYPKFLGRADLHVIQTYAIALPLLLILAFRLVTAVEQPLHNAMRRARLPRLVGLRPVSIAALVVSVGLVTGGPWVRLSEAAAGYRKVASSEPSLQQLGYVTGVIPDPGTLAAVRRALGAYLPPGAALFDFSNSPGIYYYLFGYQPGTIYFNVSIAQTLGSQMQLVDQLQTSRPLLVAMYGGPIGGLPGWDDIGNTVRHYAVAEYLLDHYHPFFSIDGFIFYALDHVDLASPQSLGIAVDQSPPGTLYFAGTPCGFGYAPTRLNVTLPPSSTASPVTLAIARQNQGTDLLTPPPGTRWSAYEWIEIDTPSRLPGDWTLGLPDQPESNIGFSTLTTSPASYRIPVGSCTQWHGYDGHAAIALTMPASQQITEVRLIP